MFIQAGVEPVSRSNWEEPPEVMKRARILVVEDERNMQAVLKLLFEGQGFEACCVSDGIEALAALDADSNYCAVVSDFKMDHMDGMGLLKAMRERGIGVPFVLITAYGTVEKAVEAMKLGAVDVVTKPFAKEVLLDVVSRCARPLVPERRRGRTQIEGLVYASPAMAEISRLVERVGPASAPVLLIGESGTGKEVLARAIHQAYAGGDFDAKPFVSVNCPAVPESLLESELFGYRKGAFTGADQDFKGKVESADGGSLFFDEIGDLPASIQPKLLRLLENRTFEPLGSGKTKKVCIRIICATNRDLRRLVAEGRFREDLYYRINTFMIDLPPLRDRREDIRPLAAYFLRKFAAEAGKDIRSFSSDAAVLMDEYTWPGNVRELKNAVERAVVLCSGTEILSTDLPRSLRVSSRTTQAPAAGGHGPDLAEGGATTIEGAERALIISALERAGGNVSAAARMLGITRNTLRYRIKKHGIETAADE